MTEIFKAKTVDEAMQKAVQQFGVSQDKIKFNVLKEAKKGFLGLGSVDAEVEATYIPVADEKPSEPVKEAVTETVESVAEEVIETVAEIEEVPAEISEEQVEIKAEETSEENSEVSDEDEYSLDNFTLIEDDNQLHPKAKIARDYIISILNAMEVSVEAKVYQNETGAIINLESDNNGTIIGRRGETLDAIQYLSSMISNKGDKDYFRITIDCFGYREKRKATLEQLASKVAKNVLKTGRSQPLEPMNPYERRVIHSAISKIEGVASRSIGEEPYRKIIISSTNPKKRSNNDRKRGGGKYNNNRKPRRESKDIDLSTSFEKDYKKPKPEDAIEGGLYGKIEF